MSMWWAFLFAGLCRAAKVASSAGSTDTADVALLQTRSFKNNMNVSHPSCSDIQWGDCHPAPGTGTCQAHINYAIHTERKSCDEAVAEIKSQCSACSGCVELECVDTKPTLHTGDLPFDGVNVGSWLCLEDWFFSGTSGVNGVFVSTTDANQHPEVGQGACLPPNVPGPLAEPWKSEGTLTKWLAETQGEAAAADALRAHRASYITEEDFKQMSAHGIKTVRIPLTWAAFADSLAELDSDTYGKHDGETETVIVPDPYHTEKIALATIPRKWLADQIVLAKKHGLDVLLDLHAMPGGSSIGTYSGIWPEEPMFWKESAKLGSKASLKAVGHMVFKGLLEWIERNYNDGIFDNVHAVTPMNEPALGMKATVQCNDIMDWLGHTSTMLVQTTLPSHGVKMYLNLHEYGWSCPFAPSVNAFMGGFPEEEAKNLVLDVHYYMAWGGCTGRNSDGGLYQCGNNADDVSNKLLRCAETWDKDLIFEPRASSEFSLSTYNVAQKSCQDKSVLDSMVVNQAAAFRDSNARAFFWTWRMPYGANFEAAWSLKHYLGLERPSEYLTCADWQGGSRAVPDQSGVAPTPAYSHR